MVSRYWLRARRFVTQKVLHTNDSPHAIALGTAIATFVAFLPLIGLQMLLVLGNYEHVPEAASLVIRRRLPDF